MSFKTKLTVGTSNSKLTKEKKNKEFHSTYTGFESCTVACPMWKDCYAKQSYSAIHEKKISSGERGYDVDGLVKDIEKLKPNTTLRLSVSGDLPSVSYKNKERKISVDSMTKIYHACKTNNIKTYTYTHLHCDPYGHKEHNLKVVKLFSEDNFNINISTEKPIDASKYFRDGHDVVMTNTKIFNFAVDQIKKGNKPTLVNKYGTIDIFPCDAQYKPNSACDTCKKCIEHNRSEVVIFKKH